MSIESMTQFFYSTLLPAIFIVPLWVTHGRYWMIGENDWVVIADSEFNERALPGIIVFHILLWWWERKRKENPLPEVALVVWGIYLLHLLFQIVHVVTEEDNTTGKEHQWSVATKIGLLQVESSRKLAAGFLLDIWIVMAAALFTSYWMPDLENSTEMQATTVGLIKMRMTQSLPSAILYAPLWYTLGHWTLGSASSSFSWELFGQALVFILPFHVFLWALYKSQQQNNDNGNDAIMSNRMATALLLYYGGLFWSQFFVARDNFLATQYSHLSKDTVHVVARTIQGFLLSSMMGMVHYAYYHEFDNEVSLDMVRETLVDAVYNALEPTTATISPDVVEEEMREPLLAADEEGRAQAGAAASNNSNDNPQSTVEAPVENA